MGGNQEEAENYRKQPNTIHNRVPVIHKPVVDEGQLDLLVVALT